MQIGLVMQTNPPASELIDYAVRAEAAGFTHFWTFDSVVMWQEPFVLYSQILSHTKRLVVGPMVTNPITRDHSVTASMFATMNELFGPRTVCGIGRGDSSVRVVGRKPATLDELRDAVVNISALANGREATLGGKQVQIPWATDTGLDVLVAGYGPRVLEVAGTYADGVIVQLADLYLIEQAVTSARGAAERAGRDPMALKVFVSAPAYVGDDIAHQRDQLRWFPGMIANHIEEVLRHHGAGAAPVPEALSSFIGERKKYDYSQHGRATNESVDFVPDEVVDRFCILGPPERHIERLEQMRELGVDQFATYLMHDAIDATLDTYASTVIPAVVDRSSDPAGRTYR